MTALRAGDAAALGAALSNDLQAAALAAPEPGRPSTPGSSTARSAASSPAPGRPAPSWPPTRGRARPRGRALRGRGRRTVKRATGRSPGAHVARQVVPGPRGSGRRLLRLWPTSSTSRARPRLGTPLVLDDVSLGVGAGERIGVVGRNGDGKTTLLGCSPASRSPTPAGSPGAAGCTVGCSPRTTTLDPAAHGPRGGARRHGPTTSGPATRASATSLDGLLGGVDAPDSGPRRAGRAAVRRRAPPGRAGRSCCVGRPRPARARRADQPPRRRGGRLARRAPRRPARARTPRRRHPRPLVPRRGLHADLGGRRRAGGRLRGRLRRVRPRQGRARPGGGRRRGAPAEPAAQGARLAAPRPAGPHVQAAVPDRGRQRADRRRAAAARPVELVRFATARLGKDVVDLEDVDGALGDRDAARST